MTMPMKKQLLIKVLRLSLTSGHVSVTFPQKLLSGNKITRRKSAYNRIKVKLKKYIYRVTLDPGKSSSNAFQSLL